LTSILPIDYGAKLRTSRRNEIVSETYDFAQLKYQNVLLGFVSAWYLCRTKEKGDLRRPAPGAGISVFWRGKASS